MLKSLNHWVFSFILSQRITNPLTGKMHYHIHYHQSLCLSTADGIPRKTAKSKLEEVVLKEGDSTIVDNPREVVTESKHNAGERESCGCNDEVIIKSTKFKAPKYFQAFLRSGKNKNKLVDLLCKTTSSSPDRAFVILQTSAIYFSKEDSCVRAIASQVATVHE